MSPQKKKGSQRVHSVHANAGGWGGGATGWWWGGCGSHSGKTSKEFFHRQTIQDMLLFLISLDIRVFWVTTTVIGSIKLHPPPPPPPFAPALSHTHTQRANENEAWVITWKSECAWQPFGGTCVQYRHTEKKKWSIRFDFDSNSETVGFRSRF